MFIEAENEVEQFYNLILTEFQKFVKFMEILFVFRIFKSLLYTKEIFCKYKVLEKISYHSKQ